MSGSEQKLITCNKYSFNRSCTDKTLQFITARLNSNDNLEIKYTDSKLHQLVTFIKADSSSDDQELYRLLYNQKVNYQVHSTPSLYPIKYTIHTCTTLLYIFY
jgi:hypothetical protein